jgi:hypothetical protein
VAGGLEVRGQQRAIGGVGGGQAGPLGGQLEVVGGRLEPDGAADDRGDAEVVDDQELLGGQLADGEAVLDQDVGGGGQAGLAGERRVGDALQAAGGAGEGDRGRRRAARTRRWRAAWRSVGRTQAREIAVVPSSAMSRSASGVMPMKVEQTRKKNSTRMASESVASAVS